MIVFMLQQPTSPTDYAMQKPDQSIYVNKPLLLICLFTFSTLAATLMNTGEAQPDDGAIAMMLQRVGHACDPVRCALPVRNAMAGMISGRPDDQFCRRPGPVGPVRGIE